MTSAELIRQRDEEAIKATFDSVAGRRFIWKILHDQCQMHIQPMVFGFQDHTSFNIGKQDIGRYIMNLIEKYNPETYNKMVKTHKKEEEMMQKENEKLQKENTDESYEDE